MNFSERLKYLRCAKIPTITQKDLANALGITQRKVSFMETGTTEPSIKDIKGCETGLHQKRRTEDFLFT